MGREHLGRIFKGNLVMDTAISFDIFEFSRSSVGRSSRLQSGRVSERDEKVRFIKERVASGQYHVDSQEIAEAMVRGMNALEQTLQSVA